MQQMESAHNGVGKSNTQEINVLHSGAYDQYQQIMPNGELSDDPNMQNLEYRVTGRLKFFNEG